MKKLLAALLFISCGKVESKGSESSLSWGMLRGVRATFMLNDTVLLCGEMPLLQMINNALYDVSSILGRFQKVDVSYSCQNRYYYQASVSVIFGNCTPPTVGYHTQDRDHHFITICGPQDSWNKIVRHESGHAFWSGCDTYRPGEYGIKFHDNCDPIRRSPYPQWSVLNGLSQNSPESYTEDDVAGIRAAYPSIIYR